MAIEDQPPPLRMEQLVQHCMANNLPLIIASDTNSHHPFWGSADYNHRGLTLSEYMYTATTNLDVANRGSEPTGWAKKTGPFLNVDNFAIVTGMSKVCKFCLEKI